MRKLIFLFAGLFMPAMLTAEQPNPAWVAHHNGPGDTGDWSQATAIAPCGNVCVTGTYDVQDVSARDAKPKEVS